MTTTLQIGIDKLDATETDAGYAYYEQGTLRWYVVDEHDVERLGEMLRDGIPDAYSLWCAETDSEQMPQGWEPGVEVSYIVVDEVSAGSCVAACSTAPASYRLRGDSVEEVARAWLADESADPTRDVSLLALVHRPDRGGRAGSASMRYATETEQAEFDRIVR